MTGPDTWSDIADVRYQRRAMGAWERLVRGDGLLPGAVRDVVERSWMRCIGAHVDPGFMHAPDPLAESAVMALRQQYRELIEASAPILTQARDVLSDSGTMMILTDPVGVILQTEGDPATLEAGLDVRLVAGASWNELQSGTNAIGAAVSAGGPACVHGVEHFCAGIKRWTCSATTVRDPMSGEPLGVVDISGLRETFSRHWLVLAMSAAGRVEERLRIRELELRQRLLEWGLGRLSRATSGGLLFFDRKGRLAAADERARSSLAGTALDPGSTRLDLAMLPQWLRAARLEPVFVRGEWLGSIAVLPDGSSATRRSDETFAMASIAHEVNQPLASVVASAGASLRWLAHEPPNLAEAREGLERIIRQGKRAAEIVSCIRSLVEGRPPRKERLDLNEVIRGFVALTRDDAQKQRVSLETLLSPDLPAVLADRVQVQQVIANLTRNALEAMSASDGPRELCFTSSRTPDASQVVVEVKDTGRGIDAATAEHMFDQFYTTKPGGMGIGLAISRSIIEAHGGKLWAMQNSPCGTIFLFSLPATI